MNREQVVLIAEDNSDDAFLLRRAVDKAGIEASIRLVSDGEQVLLYLQGMGAYANREANPKPAFMIIDLKMPRKGGLEVLEWLQLNPEYAVFPTVIMSASNIESDVQKAYSLGATSYFLKPSSFEDLVETMRSLKEYWTKAKTINPSL